MTFQIVEIQPTEALNDFAQVYGCVSEDFAPTLRKMERVWKAVDESGVMLGVIGWRPSPMHGVEIIGGVPKAQKRTRIALALLQAVLLLQPKAYTYADAVYWPLDALQQAGLKPYRAYTRSSGNIPNLNVFIPEGFKIVSLSQITDLGQRWAAQEGWSDLIGHTFITEEDILPNSGGSDDDLGCIVLDKDENAVGVCRAWREGDKISITTPAVRPEVRERGLRQAMLVWVCHKALAQNVQTMVLESWGDTEEDCTEDKKLGLAVDVVTPIYATPH